LYTFLETGDWGGGRYIPRVRSGFVEFLLSWLICLGAVWSILAVYSSISGLEMAIQVFLQHVEIFRIIHTSGKVSSLALSDGTSTEEEIKISC